jgi:hypothetical protein
MNVDFHAVSDLGDANAGLLSESPAKIWIDSCNNQRLSWFEQSKFANPLTPIVQELNSYFRGAFWCKQTRVRISLYSP